MTVMALAEKQLVIESGREQCVARLTHVAKSYGKTNALQDLDLEVYSGEVVVLLGRNGAGKTTTVRVLVGLTQPMKGSVSVFGDSPRSMASRRKMGVQLQISQMPGTLRVREYIKLFSSYYPNSKPFAEVIESARLGGLEGRLFKQLSGGEQQRLRFALAICGNPDLVILDEPTAGMDIESRLLVWDQIRGLRKEGKTVLFTTHQMEEANALADRIVVIQAGRVVAEGTPKGLSESFGVKHVRCTSRMTLATIQAMEHVVTAEKRGDNCEIETSDSDAVIRQLVNSGVDVTNIEVAPAGLEESFLAIMRLNEERRT
jgi:ABC-2 type transport system ATP-binding protein